MVIRLSQLKKSKSKITGCNHSGKKTLYHRGGEKKRNYRFIDFRRMLFNIPAVVLTLEYDPNRTAFISLILYKNGFLSYILAPTNLRVGDFVISSKKETEIKVGNCLELGVIPVGTLIYNIELYTGKGGQLCRAAGCFGLLLAKYKLFHIVVRLSSGEEYILHEKNLASIGIVSNINHIYINLKKAGVSRNRGRRPIVRGVAMNPIDHPHGGGEGKTSGGRPSVSPWGKLTKGPRTRNCRKINQFILKTRRLS